VARLHGAGEFAQVVGVRNVPARVGGFLSRIRHRTRLPRRTSPKRQAAGLASGLAGHARKEQRRRHAMAMDRSSNKHGSRLDDEMKHEVEGQMRAGRPTRAEEWHDPEPIETEDSPDTLEEIRARARAEREHTESGQVTDRGDHQGREQAEPRTATERDATR
jgi:hypothetical protein